MTKEKKNQNFKYLNILCFMFYVLYFSGCKPSYKDEEIPSYIRVDKVYLRTDYTNEGDSFHNITDVWLDESGQVLGAYQIPVSIPVLDAGKKQVAFNAGVKENGTAATRNIYPFYAFV